MKHFVWIMGLVFFVSACTLNIPASNSSSSTVSGVNSSSTSLSNSSVSSIASSSSSTVSLTSSSTNSSVSSVTSSASFSSSVPDTSWLSNAQALPVLTVSNFTNYSIDLPAYGYQIIYLSNFSDTSHFDTSTGWWKDAVGYQVFVRSFYDSDGNGIGDLAGLSAKLDYITNLGCDLVWTLPIFSSPSIHGYDISDYYAIESDYGTQSDFDNYVATAHSKGVKVVLDMVLNHSAWDNPWFQASRDSTNPNHAKYADWYVWTNASLTNLESAGWGAPWGGGTASDVWKTDTVRNELYYTAFMYGGMPDFNYRCQAVRDEMTNVAAYWLARGVDGYRMDAGRYIMEDGPGIQADTAGTLTWWRDYRSAVKQFKSTAFTVGEIWTAESTVDNYYDNGLGLDMSFTFDFYYALKDVFINASSANLRTYLAGHNSLSAPWSFFAPFMDNHDEPDSNNRLMDSIGNNFEALRASAAITLTFPGTPFIYYGTEYGMKKSSDSGDIAKRTPMQWDNSANAGFTTGTPWQTLSDYADPRNVAAQLFDTNSVWYSFRDLIRLRKSLPALRRGSITPVIAADSAVLAYVRGGTNGSVLVLVNVSSNRVQSTLDFTGSGLSASSTYPLVSIMKSPSNGTVSYQSTYSIMYLRGTFNSWGTTAMSLIADNIWQATVAFGSSGSEAFKFDTSGAWTSGLNWGDTSPADGVADVDSSDNIAVTDGVTATITFNDSTLAYSVSNN